MWIFFFLPPGIPDELFSCMLFSSNKHAEMQNNILQGTIDWTGWPLMVKMSLATGNQWIWKWRIMKLVIIISNKRNNVLVPKNIEVKDWDSIKNKEVYPVVLNNSVKFLSLCKPEKTLVKAEYTDKWEIKDFLEIFKSETISLLKE